VGTLPIYENVNEDRGRGKDFFKLFNKDTKQKVF